MVNDFRATGDADFGGRVHDNVVILNDIQEGLDQLTEGHDFPSPA
jgi:hypothetical protein